MLLSTTSTLEGKTIVEYRGIVFGEVINGMNSRSKLIIGQSIRYN